MRTLVGRLARDLPRCVLRDLKPLSRVEISPRASIKMGTLTRPFLKSTFSRHSPGRSSVFRHHRQPATDDQVFSEEPGAEPRTASQSLAKAQSSIEESLACWKGPGRD